jgi:hypothetical protein
LRLKQRLSYDAHSYSSVLRSRSRIKIMRFHNTGIHRPRCHSVSASSWCEQLTLCVFFFILFLFISGEAFFCCLLLSHKTFTHAHTCKLVLIHASNCGGVLRCIQTEDCTYIRGARPIEVIMNREFVYVFYMCLIVLLKGQSHKKVFEIMT